MKQENKHKCPEYGSVEFITEPNRYDCLRIINRKFQVQKSEFIDEKERIFCRECGAEIDEKALLQNEKVVLITTRQML